MPTSNGNITAPVSIKDIQTTIGVAEGGYIDRLIIKAAYGGVWNATYNIQQAFYTEELYQEGVAAIGYLIPKTEPCFNIFSEKSPVEWVQFGEELRPRLHTADWLKPSQNNRDYGFNILDFDGYKHNEIKAELHSPANITSDSTTKNIDIQYSMPQWMNRFLPEVNDKSFYVLTTYIPNEDPYGIRFNSVVRILQNQGAFIFQTRLEGIPQYIDEELDLDFYVSVWEYTGSNINIPSLEKEDYTFQYRMPDIAKMYHTVMNIKGTKDRPQQVISMVITIDESTTGKLAYGSYVRINSNTIEVSIFDLELISNAQLWSDDLGYSLGTIYMDYYPVYKKQFNFPSTNYTKFTLKPI